MYYFAHISILLVILLVAAVYDRRIISSNIESIAEQGKFFISPRLPWILVFGYVAVLAGLRSGMNDTFLYIYYFNIADGSWNGFLRALHSNAKDPGWGVIVCLFKMLISRNYHVFFLFIALLEAALFTHVLRRRSVSLLDACLFYYLSTLYWNNFSMMRQWLAVVVLFAGITYIERKKTFHYIILCIIAAQIHASAYLFIPIYFIVREKPWSRKIYLFTIFFVIALAASSSTLEILNELMQDTTYDYIVEIMREGYGSSAIRPLISSVPVVMAFMFRKEIDEPTVNICINFSLINLLLSILAVFTSGLYVIRLSVFTSVYLVILFPYLINVVARDKKMHSLRPAYWFFYALFFVYQMNYNNMWIYKSDVLTFLTNY